MKLSGQNVTIIVVALALVALLLYALYKGRNARVMSKFGGNEIGVELGGAPTSAASEGAPGTRAAAGFGDISHNALLENAKLRGNQQIHVGHEVGTSSPPQPGEKDS
jgi:hypothetical protein